MDFQQHVKPAYQITIAVEQTFPSELRLALSTKNLTGESQRKCCKGQVLIKKSMEKKSPHYRGQFFARREVNPACGM